MCCHKSCLPLALTLCVQHFDTEWQWFPFLLTGERRSWSICYRSQSYSRSWADGKEGWCMERVQGSCCCGYGVGDHAKGIYIYIYIYMYQAFSTQACLCLLLIHLPRSHRLKPRVHVWNIFVKSVGLKEYWGQKLNSCSKQVSVVGKIDFRLNQYSTQFDSEFPLFPSPNYL